MLSAIVVLRGAYGLRTRLIVVFLALALVPTLLTTILLWRELQPEARIDSSRRISQSMESGLMLARMVLTDRWEMAQNAAESARTRLLQAPRVTAVELGGLLPESYSAFLCTGPSGAEQVELAQTPWSRAASQQFVRDVLPRYQRGSAHAQLIDAPDSSRVVVGVSGPVEPPYDRAGSPRWIVVALPVAAPTAQAIAGTVENIQRSRQLGILEQLQVHSAAKVLVWLTALFVVAAIALGVTLSKTLTRPIRRLQQAFADVTGDNMGRQVSPVPPGELGRLTESFNEMSRDLQTSHDQLVQATRLAAWQDVARRLAHEIKNPLTPITLSIHRLRRRIAKEDIVVAECLDTILEETSHLEHLANEFASFARLPKPELHSIDSIEILRQVLDLYAAHPNLQIHTQLETVPRVMGDRGQVRQVFTNLVKNAVESMPEGGPLDVEVAHRQETVAFTFRDRGGGFDESIHRRIFEPTFTTKASGSGLGLAIVQRILEDHGGCIETGNRAGGGAWVCVQLRVADVQSADC